MQKCKHCWLLLCRHFIISRLYDVLPGLLPLVCENAKRCMSEMPLLTTYKYVCVYVCVCVYRVVVAVVDHTKRHKIKNNHAFPILRNSIE